MLLTLFYIQNKVSVYHLETFFIILCKLNCHVYVPVAEKRRLTSNYRNATVRYSKVNIIDEHILKKSEIYAPLMRHGEHPKRWHQVIDEHLKVFKTKFRGRSQRQSSSWALLPFQIRRGALQCGSEMAQCGEQNQGGLAQTARNPFVR